jgi:hypothetical protein
MPRSIFLSVPLLCLLTVYLSFQYVCSADAQGGNLNAIRWNDWKLNFAVTSGGNIAIRSARSPCLGPD